MALPDADLKILWSRAAGLCSFPDCRQLLVRFSKGSDGFYHLGEMAHLVARSLKGPRGKGSLSANARDRYENHILLCPTCHTEIDKNAASYPTKRLLEFKAAHESWVAETLLVNIGKRSGFLNFYASLLQRMENVLLFDRWTWMIDHLWRDLAPTEAIDSGVLARTILLKAIWPGSLPSLEAAMKAVLSGWSDFSLHFASGARYRDGDAAFMLSDHVYRGIPIKARQKAEQEQEKWSTRNGELLFDYVKNLNQLIREVRETLNPAYRQEEGYFIIHDELGYRNDGASILIRPGVEQQTRK
jgi:hypothetical protein